MRSSRPKENEWQKLTATARAASREAYAPYSNLRVGAALESARGRSYSACNVENSSLGLTVCAERAALFRAVAEGERQFLRLVIYSPDAGPLPPCGACRQVLAEFCPELHILSVGRGGVQKQYDLAELLPDAFRWPGDDSQRAGEGAAEGEGRRA